MSTSSAKRSLFNTPSRATKRRKASNATAMRIPRSLMPETRQFTQSATTGSFASYTSSVIPQDMMQGDGGSQFTGSKFRMTRLRVHYDYSNLTLTSGVRIIVYIPKDPSGGPLPIVNSTTPINTRQTTVLYDRLLPDDPSMLAGTFDVMGPINVEMNEAGTAALKNNITLVVLSNGSGPALRNATSYAVWFTDC